MVESVFLPGRIFQRLDHPSRGGLKVFRSRTVHAVKKKKRVFHHSRASPLDPSRRDA